jgi:hypothetical protein
MHRDRIRWNRNAMIRYFSRSFAALLLELSVNSELTGSFSEADDLPDSASIRQFVEAGIDIVE